MSHVRVSFAAEAAPQAGWVAQGASVFDRLNEPYIVHLDLESDQATAAEPLELLGSKAEVRFLHEESDNGFSGIVSSVRALGRDPQGEWVRCRITLEPALAASKYGRDTRIFQEQTVVQILQTVLDEQLGPYGRSVRVETQRAYPAREYTLQYGESAYDFVHRLMEEEGILYYFEQDGGVETMVLLDDATQHPEVDGGALLEYTERQEDLGGQGDEAIHHYEPGGRTRGTQVATRHFDWTHPSAMITGDSPPGPEGDLPNGAASGPARQSYEVDEPFTLHAFSGAYGQSDVSDQVRIRREAQARDASTFEGRSTVVSLRAGRKLDVNGHPNVSLNASYVTIETRHFFGEHIGMSGAPEAEGYHYLNRFTTVPSTTPWRPRRVRPRPRIHGIQTAIVTGPPGEEIHCDEHGRVKVQFHWDRVGAYDERTTCWIRLTQTWSGPGFGSFVLPRIGQEVVVSFIDGDPDRPIVTGTVYNGDNPVPANLPADKARTTLFKSNSTPGGNGFNELRLDDTKHAEEIWLQGEKDWNTLIKNDLTRDVLHDEIQNVVNDRTRTVGNDEDLTVGVDRDRRVGNDESVTIGKNRTKKVGVNETLTVGAVRTRMVGAAENVTIGATQTIQVGMMRNITVGASQATQIGASASRSVGADDQLSIGNNQSLAVANDQEVLIGVNELNTVGADSTKNIGANYLEAVGATRTRTVGTMETVNVGINQMINVGVAREVSVAGVQTINTGTMMVMTAGTSFEIVCGSSKLKMESGGKVTITGTEFEFLASGDVKIGGSMIHLN